MVESWIQNFSGCGSWNAQDRVFTLLFSLARSSGSGSRSNPPLAWVPLCVPGGGLRSRGESPDDSRKWDHRALLYFTPTYSLPCDWPRPPPRRRSDLRANPGAANHRGRRARKAEAFLPVRAQIEAGLARRASACCDHHGMTEVGPVTYECPARLEFYIRWKRHITSNYRTFRHASICCWSDRLS